MSRSALPFFNSRPKTGTTICFIATYSNAIFENVKQRLHGRRHSGPNDIQGGDPTGTRCVRQGSCGLPYKKAAHAGLGRPRKEIRVAHVSVRDVGKSRISTHTVVISHISPQKTWEIWGTRLCGATYVLRVSKQGLEAVIH